MAGLRIGFGVSCEENIDKLREVRQPYNIGRLNQVLGSLILREGSLIEKNINEVIKNRDVFYNRLEKIAKNVRGFEVLKSKANFLYIETRRGESIYEFLLKSNIKVRLFESGLRITVGKMDENLEVAKKLEEYFEMEEICDLAI